MFSLTLFRPGSVREAAPGSNRFLRQCAIIASALALAACATPPGTDTDSTDTSTALSTKSAKPKPARAGAGSAKADDRGNWNLFGLQDDNAPSQSSIDGLRADMGTFEQRGMASWYGKGFHGRKTANGERFDMRAMTAAHPSLPLDSWVLVRNLRNNKVAVVRINDRGPYHGGRILDLSYAAAKRLSFVDHGATQVEIRRLSRTEVAALGPNIEAGGNEAGDGSGADEVPDTANTLVPVKKAKSRAATVKHKRK
ncbi:septal ring lytic transglycosylase RlpA family protein [Cupriavidus pauculus]|uniref:septal ring lytic transglycosylase RlpA family protein n=1 Tax=Cupriavidus pauculus TaxID=82633 RepID=UPI001EE237A2|nr:septal ring lytic transglycosylase RlpA family protein [Cupriavidus pauculus]GJG98063.1 septal ring lytic transglycosylase RlpA family protein [Cupriavidus pauculus]